jgi:hypothetical protein
MSHQTRLLFLLRSRNSQPQLPQIFIRSLSGVAISLSAECAVALSTPVGSRTAAQHPCDRLQQIGKQVLFCWPKAPDCENSGPSPRAAR